MTLKLKLKFIGVEKAQQRMNINKQVTERAIRTSMMKIGLFMEGEIKQSIAGRKSEKASVDTGRFLNSISSKARPEQVTIYDGVKYGKFMEFGTSRINARRHFRNSMARNKNTITNFISKSINKVL